MQDNEDKRFDTAQTASINDNIKLPLELVKKKQLEGAQSQSKFPPANETPNAVMPHLSNLDHMLARQSPSQLSGVESSVRMNHKMTHGLEKKLD